MNPSFTSDGVGEWEDTLAARLPPPGQRAGCEGQALVVCRPFSGILDGSSRDTSSSSSTSPLACPWFCSESRHRHAQTPAGDQFQEKRRPHFGILRIEEKKGAGEHLPLGERLRPRRACCVVTSLKSKAGPSFAIQRSPCRTMLQDVHSSTLKASSSLFRQVRMRKYAHEFAYLCFDRMSLRLVGSGSPDCHSPLSSQMGAKIVEVAHTALE